MRSARPPFLRRRLGSQRSVLPTSRAISSADLEGDQFCRPRGDQLPRTITPRRIAWAQLLARVFALDVTVARAAVGRAPGTVLALHADPVAARHAGATAGRAAHRSRPPRSCRRSVPDVSAPSLQLAEPTEDAGALTRVQPAVGRARIITARACEHQPVIISLVAAAGAAFTWIMVVALARPTGPVTINAQGAVINVSRDGAPLPQVRERDTVVALPDGRVRVLFKAPWRSGAAHADMPPDRFLARLCALVPPPHVHTTRYFGVFANRHHLRARILPPSRVPAPGQQLPSTSTSPAPPRRTVATPRARAVSAGPTCSRECSPST